MFPERKLLLIDQCDVHLKPEAVDKIKNLNTDILFIPKRLTSILQPLDSLVNKEFKRLWKNSYQSKLEVGKTNLDKSEIVTDIFNIWMELKRNIIIKSFYKTVMKEVEYVNVYHDDGNVIGIESQISQIPYEYESMEIDYESDDVDEEEVEEDLYQYSEGSEGSNDNEKIEDD